MSLLGVIYFIVILWEGLVLKRSLVGYGVVSSLE